MKGRLIEGEEIIFSNSHLTDGGFGWVDEHDMRIEFFEGGRDQWRTGFKIWLNGSLIFSSKTFGPAEKRVKELIEKYSLTEVTE